MHLYGKAVKPGRKVGHVTVTGVHQGLVIAEELGAPGPVGPLGPAGEPEDLGLHLGRRRVGLAVGPGEPRDVVELAGQREDHHVLAAEHPRHGHREHHVPDSARDDLQRHALARAGDVRDVQGVRHVSESALPHACCVSDSVGGEAGRIHVLRRVELGQRHGAVGVHVPRGQQVLPAHAHHGQLGVRGHHVHMPGVHAGRTQHGRRAVLAAPPAQVAQLRQRVQGRPGVVVGQVRGLRGLVVVHQLHRALARGEPLDPRGRRRPGDGRQEQRLGRRRQVRGRGGSARSRLPTAARAPGPTARLHALRDAAAARARGAGGPAAAGLLTASRAAPGASGPAQRTFSFRNATARSHASAAASGR